MKLFLSENLILKWINNCFKKEVFSFGNYSEFYNRSLILKFFSYSLLLLHYCFFFYFRYRQMGQLWTVGKLWPSKEKWDSNPLGTKSGYFFGSLPIFLLDQTPGYLWTQTSKIRFIFGVIFRGLKIYHFFGLKVDFKKASWCVKLKNRKNYGLMFLVGKRPKIKMT